MIVVAGLVAGQSVPGHAQQASDLSSDQIRQAARDVMNSREFRQLRDRSPTPDDEESFLSRWMDQLSETEQTSSNTEPGGGLANVLAGGIGQLVMVLALVAVAVLIGVATVLVIRSIERRRKKSDVQAPALSSPAPRDLAAPPGELSANQYRLRAEEFARQGDYRSAIRQLLLGSMSWIERAGHIRFRQGLTNRDYYRAVYAWQARRTAFAGIALEFEKVFFGRRDATLEMYQTSLSNFAREFEN